MREQIQHISSKGTNLGSNLTTIIEVPESMIALKPLPDGTPFTFTPPATVQYAWEVTGVHWVDPALNLFEFIPPR